MASSDHRCDEFFMANFLHEVFAILRLRSSCYEIDKHITRTLRIDMLITDG